MLPILTALVYSYITSFHPSGRLNRPLLTFTFAYSVTFHFLNASDSLPLLYCIAMMNATKLAQLRFQIRHNWGLSLFYFIVNLWIPSVMDVV